MHRKNANGPTGPQRMDTLSIFAWVDVNTSRWLAPGVGTFTYDGIYYDIVENERIIYAYSFSFGQGNAGTTLTTIELADAESGGTLLKITEQGAYLDGFDGPKFWASGTTSLLDRLNQHLEQ